MKKQFTKTAVSLIAMAALTLTACGDSDDDEQPDTDPIPTSCVLTRMIDDAGNETRFTYNDQGYVSTIMYDNSDDFDGPELITTYVYDTDNRVIRQDYIEEDEDGGYTTYTYTEDLLTKSEYYKDDVLIKTEYFSYNNGRVERITDSEGKVMTFTYNGAGNITTITSTEEDYPFLVEFENYDSKKTPFTAVKGYLNIYEYSVNNPIKFKTSYDLGGDEVWVITSSFEYDYNELNLPISIAETTDGDWGGTITTTLTYQCD